jgi:hypothetical protein
VISRKEFEQGRFMEFKPIKELLRAKNLKNPFLKILHPENNQYSILAFQPKAEIEVNEDEKYLRSKNRDLITKTS